MQRFEYDSYIESDPYVDNWDFIKKVEKGWRLVTVVKLSKDRFVHFWERPYNG